MSRLLLAAEYTGADPVGQSARGQLASALGGANPVSGLTRKLPVDQRYRTEVSISPFRSEFATRIPKKLDTIANRVIAHFVSYFTNMSHPNIVLRDDAEEINLFDAFTEKVERDGDYDFEIEDLDASFVMHCFLLD
jgi:hypothetical protein